MDDLFICERCNENKDVTMFYINDEPRTYCKSCYDEMFTKKKRVGRPTLGITKKISLTLSEDEWIWLEKKKNRSKFIRELIQKEKQS